MSAEQHQKYRSLKVTRESFDVLEQIRMHEVFRGMMYKDIISALWPRCPQCGKPLVKKVTGRGVFCVGCRKEYSLQPAV
jgi:ssDNA-binding Zn-finger/Zn-ribbon topoisomerase 1